jgi:spoIIIJ-associated protein
MSAEEEGVEVDAKTIDEAIEQALAQLGLPREQVQIKVISPGSPGLLGLGGDDARVRVTPLTGKEGEPRIDEEEVAAGAEVVVKEIDAPEVELSVEYLQRLLAFLGVEADVTVRLPETPGDGQGRASAVLDVDGDDLGILIGRRGSTLASLQYLVNLMVTRELKGKVLISVDVERYKRRREDSLCGLAQRLAERVKQTGRTFTLEPMPAAERRIVHLALADDSDVVTSSVGYGESRKVAISLRPGRPDA